MESQNNLMRYERKYVINQNEKFRILHLIKNSDLLLKSVFYPRIINSIYYDTESLELYKQNIEGLNKRKKYRVRWYSDKDFSNLEIKIKNGYLGHKKIYPLGPILKKNGEISFKKIDRNFSNLKKDIKSKLIFNMLRPNLYVRYKRSYFISKVIDCRLTLDEEIKYYKIINKHINIKPRKTLNSVIELKYPSNLDTFELNYFSKFLFRYSKHSKYVNGIQHFL